MKQIDCVILSWSKSPAIKTMTQEAIKSLHASSIEHQFRVFLIETAKGDIKYDGATVIQPNVPFNYNVYMNIGIKLCSSEFIIMANNDVYFHPGWFEAIAARNCDSASPINPMWAGHDQYKDKVVCGYRAGLHICGWCIVIKKSVLDIIGPLDPKFSFWYQDCDLSVQLSSRKFRHILVGTSLVTHRTSASHELLAADELKKQTMGLHHVFKSKYPNFNETTCRNGDDTTICLTMIVKDEAKIIAGLLEQVAKHIDYWCIVDTGSTDSTQQIIKDFFDKRNVPGVLHERPWVNFGHNRSESMALADGLADYMWVIDADDGVIGTPVFKKLTMDSYAMRIGQGFSHWRCQLFKSGLKWTYKGVVHEYAHSDLAKTVGRLYGDYYIAARCAGARNSDPQKYQKDAILLEGAVKADPNNGRDWFYLAQSYFDYGDFKEAKRCYEHRVAMGGWVEEQFYAQWRVGQCAIKLEEPQEQVIAHLLKAYEIRPVRAEALVDLAAYCRGKSRNALGYMFAKVAAAMPYPEQDSLFIFKDIYDYRAKDELAVNAYWIGKMQEAYDICENVIANNLCPPDQMKRQVMNRNFAAQKIGIECPKNELHVLRPGAIGDIIMTLWAIEGYARKNPSHKIYYHCHKQLMEIPLLSRAVTKAMDATFAPHYAVNLVGYPLKEGYPDKPMARHLIEYFGEELGLTEAGWRRPWLPRLPKLDIRGSYITIQPKTGWSPYKEWPTDRWQEIVNRIRSVYPKYAIMQIGAANEPALTNCVKSDMPITTSIATVAKARLHLGSDSFGNHVRGAMNAPAVILWGSTSPVGSGYDSAVNIWHSKENACSPCYREYPDKTVSPKPHCPSCKDWSDISHPCMLGITVDEVWAAVQTALSRPS